MASACAFLAALALAICSRNAAEDFLGVATISPWLRLLTEDAFDGSEAALCTDVSEHVGETSDGLPDLSKFCHEGLRKRFPAEALGLIGLLLADLLTDLAL